MLYWQQAIKLPSAPAALKDYSQAEYLKTQAYQIDKWWVSVVMHG